MKKRLISVTFAYTEDKRTHRIALEAARVSMIDVKAEDIWMMIHDR